MAVLKEFFGFGGYQRLAEGFLSWQHLLFVSILNILMAIFALAIGYHFKTRSTDEKNRVLVASAIAVDALELFKIVVISIRSADPLSFLNDLPLFLCSVHLIAIPMAAFGRGRLREASLDFVCVFGLLGAVLGTYCAGNNYSVYPVLSLDNVVSGLTHILSGFASLYILISGMASMKKQNIRLTVGILLGFCAAAWLANLLLDYNYMFLKRADGTPYEILYRLVNGHPVLYPVGVVALFLIYIRLYYHFYYAITAHRCRRSVKTA